MRPHDGCDDNVEPLPASHSSPTDWLRMPSPHRTNVQLVVHLGPLPFLVLSSHSSGTLIMPLPHKLDVCPVKFIAPSVATTANTAATPNESLRVSAGNPRKKDTRTSSGEACVRAIGWMAPFWWSRHLEHPRRTRHVSENARTVVGVSCARNDQRNATASTPVTYVGFFACTMALIFGSSCNFSSACCSAICICWISCSSKSCVRWCSRVRSL